MVSRVTSDVAMIRYGYVAESKGEHCSCSTVAVTRVFCWQMLVTRPRCEKARSTGTLRTFDQCQALGVCRMQLSTNRGVYV